MGPLWKEWETRCEFVIGQLDTHEKLSVSMPEGGFYAWVDVERTGLSSKEFCTRLIQEKQVAAVPGGSFGPASDRYVRLTCVRSWDEVREGVRRVREFVDGPL